MSLTQINKGFPEAPLKSFLGHMSLSLNTACMLLCAWYFATKAGRYPKQCIFIREVSHHRSANHAQKPHRQVKQNHTCETSHACEIHNFNYSIHIKLLLAESIHEFSYFVEFIYMYVVHTLKPNIVFSIVLSLES